MSRNSHFAFLVGAVLVLSACTVQEEVTRDVAWYMGHTQERMAKLDSCSNDPGGLGTTVNCKNALAAKERLVWGSAKDVDVRPIDFSKGPNSPDVKDGKK